MSSAQEKRLRQIAGRIAKTTAALRALEAERDVLLAALSNGERGSLTRLAEMSGVTKGRVHQILKGRPDIAPTEPDDAEES